MRFKNECVAELVNESQQTIWHKGVRSRKFVFTPRNDFDLSQFLAPERRNSIMASPKALPIAQNVLGLPW